MKSKNGVRIMNAVSIISGLMLIATVVSYFAIIPVSVTVHVGDDGDRVHEIGRYGYIKTRFSIKNRRDAGDEPLQPSTFWIWPDDYHLMIWHNGKIDSMEYFRIERPVPPNRRGEWYDHKEVDSFTVDRPSPGPFFRGIAILGGTGYLLKRFPRTSIALYAILILFVILMVVCYSTLAETFAIQPMLVAVGWLTAPILGRSMTHHRTFSPGRGDVL